MMEKYGLMSAHAQPISANPPVDPDFVFDTLVKAGVAGFYPDFQGWFYGKVIPGLRKGERCIFHWMIDNKLAGIAVCKRTTVERKLCTLWVSPDFRARGVAGELARNAFAWMDDFRPLFTVPEERSSEFSRLVRSWSFPRCVPHDGLYRTGRIEYVFNGPLTMNEH